MNRIIFYRKTLLLTLLSCLSISAYAWYTPTYTYSAKVQAGLSTSSTGGGLVYVDNEATDYITVPNNSWRPNSQYNGCEGGNSSNTENAYVNVYLYAKENIGYQFDGWTIDSQTVTPGNKGTKNGSVWSSVIQFQVGNNDYGAYYSHPYREKDYQAYAFFSPIKYYITYDANGGSVSPSTPQEYTIRSTDPLRTPTKNGYTFNGWKVTAVDESDGGWTLNGNAPSALNKNIGNVSLKAQWTPTDYTISFSANGGSGTTPSSIPYTIESAAITLPDCPYTRSGYVFAGWKPSSNVGSWTTSQTFANLASIPTGQYGNVTLVAQWEKKANITITVTGLDNNESAMFTVSSGGSVLYTVSLSGSNPSVTIKDLPTGVNYTVKASSSWSWAYGDPDPTGYTFGLGTSGYTANFTYSKNTSAKKHDEKINVNWHTPSL